MQRIQSLDYARGFTVLCIPAIHTVMVFSKEEVYTTWYGYILTFIAEGPGAQLFMMIMGIVFTLKEKHSTKTILTRAIVILLAGFALNTFKFIIPVWLFDLPPGIKHDLQLIPGKEITELLLIGDILHFAAIALVIIHCVYRLKNYWFWSLLIALICIIASPLLWDISDNYFIQLFTGQPPRIFFPVLSWIIYPLIGLTIGYLIKRNITHLFYRMSMISMACICAGAAITILTNNISLHGFYRTCPGETLIHIGIVLLAFTGWNYIARQYRENHFLFLLHYCSKHITSIYIMQWILICWWIPVVGYQTLGLWPSILGSLFFTISTYILNELYLIIKTKYGHQ